MLRHHVRAAIRVAPGRPALWIGLRVAAALGVPLLLSPWLDPVIVRWASFAGYSIALVDAGGAYRARATAMLAAAIGSVGAVGLGTAVAGTVAAPLVVVAGLAACALGHVGGLAGARITMPIAIALTLAAMTAGHGADALATVSGAALGGAWALVLSLVLWPVRVYKPGRRALSNVFAGLADHAERVAEGAAAEVLRHQHRALREGIEVARATLVASRRARGERDRGERLVALTQVCDRLFGVQLALAEVLAGAPPRDEVALALRAHATQLDRLAALILLENPPADAPAPLARTTSDAVGHVLAGLADQVAIASRLVTSLEAPPRIAYGHEVKPERGEWLHLMLAPSAVVIRHALRVALTIGITVGLTAAWHLRYGYWLVVTAYLLLQPYRASTVTRALQRTLGTVVGATIAIGLTTYLRDPTILALVTVAFAGLGAAVMHLSYGLFSMFLTPSFILIAELHTQDFALAGDRIEYTLVGSALAVAASLLLWPRRERDVFDESLAATLTASARYAGVVHEVVAGRVPEPTVALLDARRHLGRALVDTEAALDRLVQDGATDAITGPRMAALATLHRIAGALNVVARTRAHAPPEADLAGRSARIERRLRALGGAGDADPAPAAPTAPADERELASFALDRLELYLDSLGAALARRAEPRA